MTPRSRLACVAAQLWRTRFEPAVRLTLDHVIGELAARRIDKVQEG